MQKPPMLDHDVPDPREAFDFLGGAGADNTRGGFQVQHRQGVRAAIGALISNL
jgi:hypothetical protein